MARADVRRALEVSVRASQPHATAASGIRCKPTGVVSGFVVRLGGGTDSFGAVGGPGSGVGGWPQPGGGSGRGPSPGGRGTATDPPVRAARGRGRPPRTP